jgi:hypothetical protein
MSPSFSCAASPEKSIVRDSYRQLWRTFRAADRGRAWLADDDIQRYVDAMARPGAVTAALSTIASFCVAGRWLSRRRA